MLYIIWKGGVHLLVANCHAPIRLQHGHRQARDDILAQHTHTIEQSTPTSTRTWIWICRSPGAAHLSIWEISIKIATLLWNVVRVKQAKLIECKKIKIKKKNNKKQQWALKTRKKKQKQKRQRKRLQVQHACRVATENTPWKMQYIPLWRLLLMMVLQCPGMISDNYSKLKLLFIRLLHLSRRDHRQTGNPMVSAIQLIISIVGHL